MSHDRPAGTMAPWGWLVLALSFLAAAVVLLAGYGPELAFGLASRGWPRVEAQVISVDLFHYEGPETGHTHGPRVVYAYTVNDRELRADRFSYPASKDDTPEDQLLASLRERFKVGAAIEVAYDPDRPERATLTTGAPRALVWGFGVVLATMLVAAGLCLTRWRSVGKGT